MAGGQQRCLRAFGSPHRDGRIIHESVHHATVEWRFEPSGAHEERQFLGHLLVSGHDPIPRSEPDDRLQEYLAPGGRLCLGREQNGHVGVVEPHVAQRVDRQIVADGARQHGAIDAASRSARNDIDDDTKLKLAPDLAQQIEIDILGIVLRVLWVRVVEKMRAQARVAVVNIVQGGRRPYQLEDFLADPVHVDGERDAAETYKRDPKLFLAHSFERSFFPSECYSILVTSLASCGRRRSKTVTKDFMRPGPSALDFELRHARHASHNFTQATIERNGGGLGSLRWGHTPGYRLRSRL